MRHGADEYLCFCMDKSSAKANTVTAAPDIVLERAAVESADKDICKTYQISDVTSISLQPFFRGQYGSTELQFICHFCVSPPVTTLKILRKGTGMEVSAALCPRPFLAPRFQGYDSHPDFGLIGGIIFARPCVPLEHQYFSLQAAKRPPMDFDWLGHMEDFKEDTDHEICPGQLIHN